MQYDRRTTTLLDIYFCLASSPETPSHELTSQRGLLIHHANAKDYLIYIMSKTGHREWTSDTPRELERQRQRESEGEREKRERTGW